MVKRITLEINDCEYSFQDNNMERVKMIMDFIEQLHKEEENAKKTYKKIVDELENW